MRRRTFLLNAVAVFGLGGALLHRYGRTVWHPWWVGVRGSRTVEDVVARYGPAARERLGAKLEGAGLPEDLRPERLTLIGLKEEKQLELWVRHAGEWHFVHSYPVLAASGGAGPKLRQGDLQVPEGIYRIPFLNPNSAYHLSMKLDYPNAFDRERAASDGRTNLGGDIFIHGKAASIGCLAIGDPAIEELFTVVADVGREKVSVIVAPRDLRRHPAPDLTSPAWVKDLHAKVAEALAPFMR